NDETVALGDIEPLDDAGEFDDARRLVADLGTDAAAARQSAARPFRSNSVRRHDAPTPPLSPGASCLRFESSPSSRYHSAANGKGQNAFGRQKRWMPVQISATSTESVDDERRKYRSDVLAYDNVGNFIEIGRFAIDNHQTSAVSFGEQGESRGRPYHQRRADGQKKITDTLQLCGAPLSALRHRRTKENRRRFVVPAAIGAIGRAVARIGELLTHPRQFVALAARQA